MARPRKLTVCVTVPWRTRDPPGSQWRKTHAAVALFDQFGLSRLSESGGRSCRAARTQAAVKVDVRRDVLARQCNPATVCETLHSRSAPSLETLFASFAHRSLRDHSAVSALSGHRITLGLQDLYPRNGH